MAASFLCSNEHSAVDIDTEIQNRNSNSSNPVREIMLAVVISFFI